jgi:hypothetical protein
VICTGGSTSFTATGGTSYAWTGPGGFTANTATISNLTVAGTYTVTVTNANNCTSTCSRTLTVNPLPICGITGNNVICTGGSTSFTATGGTSYAWTGPGGFIATTATISGLTVAGTYMVTVTDANGCSSSCSRTLTVNALPVCGITGNNVICTGGSASFTATGGTTYSWTGPGGFTANTATISNLTVAGTYTVTVTSGTNCTSTCSRTLTVNPLPICGITGNNVICTGGSTSFTASGGTTYSWTGPGGFTANTATISGLTVAGTYTVTVTNANNCSSTCSRTLTVNSLPICGITGNNVICVGGSASFTASGGTTYSWTGPGGFAANTATISNLTVAGTYTVIVTNANNCSSTCSRTLTVNPLPVVTADAKEVCIGATVQLTGTPAGGTWSGAHVTGSTFDATGLAAGNYTITYTVTVNGCTNSANTTIAVKMCDVFGCSLGFWKTHPEIWDGVNDPINAGFITTTNFFTYMGITPGSCGLPNSLTMLQAVSLNGGNCNAVVRQGVAALLNAAAFGSKYPYPMGATSFATLKQLLYNSLSTCSCPSALVKALDSANRHEFDADSNNVCSALGKLTVARTGTISSGITGEVQSDINVLATPNPYLDVIKFTITSSVSGQGSLEVYNVLGQKVKTVFKGFVFAGSSQTVDYIVPPMSRQSFIYIFKVGTQKVTGKVIHIK